MTTCTSDVLKQMTTLLRGLSLGVSCRLEVVEKVKFQKVYQTLWYFVFHAVLVGISQWIGRRRSLNLIDGSIQHHAGQSGHFASSTSLGKLGIGRLKPHFILQASDHKFANGHGFTVRKERADAQIGIHSFDSGSVYRTVGLHGNPSIVYAFAKQTSADRLSCALGLQQSLRPDSPQVQCDLVCEHLFKSEAEKMRCVPAVWPGSHITPEAGRAARTSMASRATVGQSGAYG